MCTASNDQYIHIIGAGLKFRDTEKTEVGCDSCLFIIDYSNKSTKICESHAETNPRCKLVQTLQLSSLEAISNSGNLPNWEIHPYKSNKDIIINSKWIFRGSVEQTDIAKARERNFSNASHFEASLKTKFIEAGFFNCNIGDRVICLYCNLICQNWILNIDDPCAVHKTLSPNCEYVKAKLIDPETSSGIAADVSAMESNLGASSLNDIVPSIYFNEHYTEENQRRQSFIKWPQGHLPSVDDLVRAGFFYTGSETIVTCFYCNGSLENLNTKKNIIPLVEHARQYPACAYAKKLCGNVLYRKILASKRMLQKFYFKSYHFFLYVTCRK